MNQNDLNRAVARATGETVSVIKRVGFMIMEPSKPVDDPTDPVYGGRAIDWDDFERAQNESEIQTFDVDLAAC